MPRRYRWILAATIVGGAGILGRWACQRANEWGFRRELPSSAADIKEWYWEDGFLPDYDYCLRARVTEAEFREYARKLNLTPQVPGRTYSEDPEPWLGFGCHTREPWWDPTASVEGALVEEGGDTWTTAKYENGYLYLHSINH